MNVITTTFTSPISPLPTPTLTPIPPGSGGADLTGLIVLAAFGIVFVVGFYLYNWLRAIKQGYPLEKQIEDALLPYFHTLLVGAFEESQDKLEEIEQAIESVDKGKLAEKLYDLLPEKIGEYDISFLQSIFTAEQFVDIFLRAYNEVREYYCEKKGHFAELFELWKSGK